jgi:hypothetical protein
VEDVAARRYEGPVREEAPTPLTARELLAAAVAYVALTLWWLWPLPAHLGTVAAYTLRPGAVKIAPADWYLIAWVLAWGAHALTTHPLGVFDANAFHPAPRSLAFSEHFLGQQPLFAPVYLASGNAVLAVNTLGLAVFVSSALAFYALARRFVGPAAALVGGVLFSFAPWRHDSLLHLHMLGVQYLPLALLFTERWLERARRCDAWLLGAALLLQALSSVYLAFALAVLYGPYVALALWRWRRVLDRRRVLGLAAVLGAVAMSFAVASVPYVALGRLGLIPSYGTREFGVAVGVVFSHLTVARYLTATGVGPAGYTLAALALLPPWRGRRWPMVVAVVACVVSVPLAWGAHDFRIGPWRLPAPFPWVVSVIPPLAAIRLPARLIVVAHLGLCLLAALGMQRIAGPFRGAIAWSLAALVIAAFLMMSPVAAAGLHRVPQCSDAAELNAWLARYGEGRAVLEWPPPKTPVGAARRMYLSTCHWLPEVGGYTAYPMRVADVVYDAGRTLPSGEALQNVVDLVDLGWIVLHASELDLVRRSVWDGALPSGLQEAARFGDTRVLRVTQQPGPGDRRSRLLSTTESLGAVPLAPLGAQCPGRVELAGGLPALRLGSITPFDLVVTNSGERAWPGWGVVPRHLVHVRACVTPPDRPCAAAPEPLDVDVPAGATRRVRAHVGVPPAVFGPQTLRVELWQLGDGPLEQCGTPPLVVGVQVR